MERYKANANISAMAATISDKLAKQHEGNERLRIRQNQEIRSLEVN